LGQVNPNPQIRNPDLNPKNRYYAKTSKEIMKFEFLQ
jgi:hypothetical protein